mgnify:CR=1 FL=1
MERLNERLTAIESVLKKIDPIESLLERITLLENTIYTTKKVFTFQEACMYIGVSESLLYKPAELRTHRGRSRPHGKRGVRDTTIL